MAERADLIAQEQTSFSNAVNAYVGVIQAQQLLELNINNEQVLAKQLQATNDRFRVGEITRTDVAQAEAALAGATAQRETAEGKLADRARHLPADRRLLPPGDLVEPQPLALPVKTEQEATALAAANNPTVIAAQFNDAAAKDAVDVAFAQLMPQVSLQGQMFQQNNAGNRSHRSQRLSGRRAAVRAALPGWRGIFRGASGEADGAADQRLVDDARRTAVQNAVQAWETLVAAKAAADSTRRRFAPTRSRWKAWSARRSSAAAPRWTC